MFLELEKADIYYQIKGKGTPILMIHGLPLDQRIMHYGLEPVFQPGKKIKRIYLDLPGMGRTRLKSKFNGTEDIFNLLSEFIQHIIPEEKFLIAGFSYGGYLARALVFQYPQRISGLLLICPVVIPDFELRAIPGKKKSGQEQKLAEQKPEVKKKKQARHLVTHNLNSWLIYNKLIRSAVKRADLQTIQNIKSNYRLSFEVDHLQDNFNRPCLFILGRQDQVAGYVDAFKIIGLYPRASFFILDQGGHYLMIEQREFMAKLVINWLERLEFDAGKS